MKKDIEDLSVIKHFMSSYGWVKHKTQGVIDADGVPNHICKDFDDDCYDLPQSHWYCWEYNSECGVCPFLLQEVTEDIKNVV